MEVSNLLNFLKYNFKESHAPKGVSVRVGLNSGGQTAGSTLNCEVEWRPPSQPNGRITKYYVRVEGVLRYPRPDGTLVPVDYPQSVDKKCANYDELENAANGINPIDFASEHHYCKYGPLKVRNGRKRGNKFVCSNCAMRWGARGSWTTLGIPGRETFLRFSF